MRRSPARRRGLVLALLAPLAGVLLAGPASAAVTAPADGAVVDSEAPVQIRADYAAWAEETRLSLQSPGGVTTVIARADRSLEGGTFEAVLLPSCWVADGSECTGRRPAPNGTWTLTLAGREEERSTFLLRVPPQPPQEVTATRDPAGDVVVSWRRGDEPDLTGWTLYDGDTVALAGIDLSACDEAGACRVAVRPAAGAEAAGAEPAYALRARRATGPEAAEQIESEPAAVALPAPASSPSPTGPGSASPSPAGSSPTPRDVAVTPGTTDLPTVRQQGAVGGGFSSTPGLGSAPQPPPGAFTAPGPTVAAPLSEEPLVADVPAGSRPGQVLRESGPPETSLAAARRAVSGALGSEQVAVSTAGILVLALAFAHVRRWAGAPPRP